MNHRKPPTLWHAPCCAAPGPAARLGARGFDGPQDGASRRGGRGTRCGSAAHGDYHRLHQGVGYAAPRAGLCPSYLPAPLPMGRPTHTCRRSLARRSRAHLPCGAQVTAAGLILITAIIKMFKARSARKLEVRARLDVGLFGGTLSTSWPRPFAHRTSTQLTAVRMCACIGRCRRLHEPRPERARTPLPTAPRRRRSLA